jgi:3-phosphoshikimate 1-carboxyvinyltransferase
MSPSPPPPSFAVAGRPVLGSRSVPLFRALFERLGVQAHYTRLSVERAEELLPLCHSLGLAGVNVTSPHKQDLVPWLTGRSGEAHAVGAVNIALHRGNGWRGDNTDIDGVRDTLIQHGVSPEGVRVLVLGAGGAARAVLRAVDEMGFASTRLCNRSLERARALALDLPVPTVGLSRLEEELSRCDLFISCISGDPGLVPAAWLRPEMWIFDADYRARGLQRAARLAGCRWIPGSDWLALQAAAGLKRFLGIQLDEPTRRWLCDQASQPSPLPDGPVVLAGFSGAGKSSVGAILARTLGWAFVDTDEELRRLCGQDIHTIFSTRGEPWFRAREQELVSRALSLPRTVVALGGGALLDPSSRAQLRANGLCILLHAPLETCLRRVRGDSERPLLRGEADPQPLWEARLPGYLESADLCLSSQDKAPWQLARAIEAELRSAGLLDAARGSGHPMTLHPGAVQGARLRAPSSKSHGIRLLAAAALSDGISQLRAPPHCEDFRRAVGICQALGATVIQQVDRLEIHGTGGRRPARDGSGPTVLGCGESALCLRLFSCLAAALGGPFSIEASGSLRSRRVDDLEEALRDWGVRCHSDGGRAPLLIEGPPTRVGLVLDASRSSQVLTGVLMAAPILPGGCSLEARGLVSRPYAALSLSVLRAAGIEVQADPSLERYRIPGGQRFRALDLEVDADWSALAFLLVAAATTGSILLRGLDLDTQQGDVVVLDVLDRAGAMVERGDSWVRVEKGALQAFEFDATHHPDLFPPLAVLAAACAGRSRLLGVGRLRNKESDRADALRDLLHRLGAAVSIEKDWMLIDGGPLRAAALDAHGDHRMAMAAAIAALRADGPCTLVGSEHVAKSYPRFFHDLDILCGGAP